MTSKKEFTQIDWSETLADDCRQIVRLAIREDLGRACDWTTVALAPAGVRGRAAVVAREGGTVAGLPAARLALDEMQVLVDWRPLAVDGQAVTAGERLAELCGPVREMLTAERLLLKLIGRLSGIATLTRQFVQAVQGTAAGIYDTRKTTPGWRRLEKYAVRCGGGRNHRTGLFDAVLIKDNHLALMQLRPGAAVRRVREFLHAALPESDLADALMVEVEVDTLEQLDDAMTARPDIILLDNMPTSQLREAVVRRDAVSPEIELEASGGVSLGSVRAVAETGVDRISVGALTHSAVSLDVALDWSA
ncbi:MAG TPA: carboxylating nicotinate-nucleotide diphosphorylase [Candidatus Anammoximicrobium sp.]|nr:carboxylating nicotinate-nucleotide diphosphorylase [Candidatus Anammoximicrobium sp.]